MAKGFTGDGDAQFIHMGKIRLAQPARLMNLGEKDLFGFSFRCPPYLYPALQRTHLAVTESARMPSLKILKKRFCFKARIGFQFNFNFSPDVLERVLTRAPIMVFSNFTGQSAQPAILSGRFFIHSRYVHNPEFSDHRFRFYSTTDSVSIVH